ncbi:MAG: hypothetical protein LIP01_00020 [Tannerellaceae bacterium]|nr:hypothetical protein [Tannerellaceae bacterium]
MDKLTDLNSLPFPWLQHFAGTLEYTTRINNDKIEQHSLLDAGLTHSGITELVINGETVGIKWYGERIFDIQDKLHPGENEITIKVTTVLSNYVRSLRDNPAATRWDFATDFKPMGLIGPVKIY